MAFFPEHSHFLSDGHHASGGHGKYGKNVERALNYVLSHAKPTGLLNMADAQRDMYNHGLSTFVLGQAYGMTSDARISSVLERSLKLIANTQCRRWRLGLSRQRPEERP